MASSTLAESDTASQSIADTKVGHLASNTSNIVGIEQASDVTGELLIGAGETGKTANVTKVEKVVKQKPVQHMHLQGVNIVYTT
jgi:hypothetical protein